MNELDDKVEQDTRMIRVISLNCWGLKYVSRNREQRIRAIATKFAREGHKYDVVCLQEIWVEKDFEVIREALLPELPFSKLFHSGILSGPGLAVFCRWPIEDASLHPFTLNGRPSAFFRGDWYVGKSVACVVIRHRPTNQLIEVMSAHMHAPYGPGDASYLCHRTCQAWDMARLAKRSSDSGYLTILVGDFNSIPGSPTYKLIENVGGLSDSWADRHGQFTDAIETLDAPRQIARAGTTCDSLLNTYRTHCKPHDAKRLDYIFYDAGRARVIDSRVSFTEEIDGIGSYSDHFAIESDFIINRAGETVIRTEDELIAQENKVLCNEILSIINGYRPTALFKRLFHGWAFWVCFLIMVGLLISVWWAADDGRTYIAFIYMIISWFIGMFMFVLMVFSCLFARMELRALREYESEVQLCLTRYP